MLICLTCALKGHVTVLNCTWTRTTPGMGTLDTYCDHCNHFSHYPPTAA